MNILLTADFGSTFTKVSAVDIDNKKIVGVAKSFTTIETNVCEGFDNALKELYAICGKIKFSKKFASSSAAGGLKMISCGLVPDLTAKASKMAASSAGAKVLKTYSYELSEHELEEIFILKPDIILLSGGIDGGNKDVIVENAKKLASIDSNFSVIVAGNKTVSGKIAEILEKSGKKAIVTENVMPEFNKLNILPAKEKIRDLFIENIIEAKGLSDIQKLMDREIVPTPLSVYEACEILEKEIGTLMAYDVGGATTDVYSMAAGTPTMLNVVIKGLPEPFAKRSVEGDIGVRYSISSLLEEAGADNISRNISVSVKEVINWVETCKKNPETLPKTETEKKIDEELASQAVLISANRHCGFFESYYTPVGETFMQTGKDLSDVKYIIGAGGSVINAENPKKILEKALFSPLDFSILKPKSAKMLLDKKNIFAAMGLLSREHPKTAVKIMQDEFLELGNDS